MLASVLTLLFSVVSYLRVYKAEDGAKDVVDFIDLFREDSSPKGLLKFLLLPIKTVFLELFFKEGSVCILEKLELTDSGVSPQFDNPSKLFFECENELAERKLESLLLSKSLSFSEPVSGWLVLL